MSLRASLAVVSLALLFAAGCEEEEPISNEDRIAAEQLLADLQQQGYRTFARAPGWDVRAPGSTDHHGAYLDIYVNDVLATAIAGGGTAPWPVGSILIKDGWSDPDGTTLYTIAVARKEAGGWFGAEYSPDGVVREAGVNYGECMKCHGTGDFVQSF